MSARPTPPSNVLAAVPARLLSTRLPEKLLADLGGRALIVHVVAAAMRSLRVGAVVVATDSDRIATAVQATGATAHLTRGDHASGSDRIVEAIEGMSPEIVLNLQGDEPLLPTWAVDRLVELLDEHPEASVSTLCVPLAAHDPALDDPHAVKVVVDSKGHALYFSRARIPSSHPTAEEKSPGLRHVGLYGYRVEALRRFAASPPSELERREGLEQLRLLSAGECIVVGVVDDIPAGVDTAEDLERVRNEWKSSGEGRSMERR